MEEDKAIFNEITFDGMPSLSVVFRDAQKAGKKTILIKDIKRIIESTINYQKNILIVDSLYGCS